MTKHRHRFSVLLLASCALAACSQSWQDGAPTSSSAGMPAAAGTSPEAINDFPDADPPGAPPLSDVERVRCYLEALSDAPFNGVIVGQNCGHGTDIGALDDQSGLYYSYFQHSLDELGDAPAMVGVDYEYLREFSLDELTLTNQALIHHFQLGGLVSVTFAPTSPSGGVYADTGDQLAPLLDPKDPSHAFWLAKLERISQALTQLRDAGVVVLFRPLQEMNGAQGANNGQFWWASQTTPANFVAVYRQMHDYFVQTKGLTNLLWVYSPIANGDLAARYPGDDYVDVIAPTTYNDQASIGAYKAGIALAGPHPFGVAEFGPNLGSAHGGFDDLRYLTQIAAQYPKVAYFMAWHSFPGAPIALIDNQNYSALLADERAITLKRLKWQHCRP